ncbi:FMN-dependent NADH-azoreductase [Aeromonas sp. 5HA1]|nr:FMN-dependent NADH-azoreductase [Aeromonas sp. 5HA1]
MNKLSIYFRYPQRSSMFRVTSIDSQAVQPTTKWSFTMANILVLKSSILGQYSQSNALIDGFLADHQSDTVTMRDLATLNLPVLDGELASGLRGGDNLNERQLAVMAQSDELIAELKGSDLVVIAAPMYNFSIPTQLKNWIDLIARAGVTFRYTETGPVGLVENTRALVISPRGGMHVGSATDLVTPYMRTVLGFIGIKDVDFIYAEGMGMGPDAQAKGIEQAKGQLETLAL